MRDRRVVVRHVGVFLMFKMYKRLVGIILSESRFATLSGAGRAGAGGSPGPSGGCRGGHSHDKDEPLVTIERRQVPCVNKLENTR